MDINKFLIERFNIELKKKGEWLIIQIRLKEVH